MAKHLNNLRKLISMQEGTKMQTANNIQTWVQMRKTLTKFQPTPTLAVTRFRVQHKKAILMAYINGRYNIMAMGYMALENGS